VAPLPEEVPSFHRLPANRRDQELEDRLLVAAFLRVRSEKAFRLLYRRHSPVLYKLILRLVGGQERDAEEVLQIAWIRAAERLDDFRWESTFRSWISGIAINCSREQRRRRQRDAGVDIESAEVPGRVPRGLTTRIDLERAIQQLPEGYREVLVLHDIEGYTHREIGELLGIEAGTSKSQLSRARRTVRDWLTQTDNGSGQSTIEHSINAPLRGGTPGEVEA